MVRAADVSGTQQVVGPNPTPSIPPIKKFTCDSCGKSFLHVFSYRGMYVCATCLKRGVQETTAMPQEYCDA